MPTPTEIIWAKRDQIKKLPPEQQVAVMDRVFDRFVRPNLGEGDHASSRARFINSYLERSAVALPEPPKEATGFGTPALEGTLRGTAQALDFATKGASALTGKEYTPGTSAVAGFSKTLHESAAALHEQGSQYEAEHPLVAGAARLGGQVLPSALLAELGGVGTATKGAGILQRAGTNLLGETAASLPFSKTVGDVATNTALAVGGGEVLRKAGQVIGRSRGAVTGAVGSAAASSQTAERPLLEQYNDLARAKFGKTFEALSYDEKRAVQDAHLSNAVNAREAQKSLEQKAKEAAKATEKQAKIDLKDQARIKAQVDKLKRREVAGLLSKANNVFFKVNKRAPTEAEVATLRSQLEEGKTLQDIFGKEPLAKRAPKAKAEAAPSVAVPAEKPHVDIDERPPGAQHPSYEAATKLATYNGGNMSLFQLMQEFKEMGHVVNSNDAGQIFDALRAEGHLSSEGITQATGEQIKMESPQVHQAVEGIQAIKEPEAAAKTPEVTKVPEGQSGNPALTEEGKVTKTKEQTAERVRRYRERQTQKAGGLEGNVSPEAQPSPENLMAAVDSGHQSLVQAFGQDGQLMSNAIKETIRVNRLGPAEEFDMLRQAGESLRLKGQPATAKPSIPGVEPVKTPPPGASPAEKQSSLHSAVSDILGRASRAATPEEANASVKSLVRTAQMIENLKPKQLAAAGVDRNWANAQLELLNKEIERLDSLQKPPASEAPRPTTPPGAAAVHDPGFEYQQLPKITSVMQKAAGATMDQLSTGAMTSPEQRRSWEQMQQLYQSNPFFKRVADSVRHYVHNNPVLVDASRDIVGMERIHNHRWTTLGTETGEAAPTEKAGIIRATKLLDGKFDNRNLMPAQEARQRAEDLLALVRESEEHDRQLSRGLAFTTRRTADLEKADIFGRLRPGDVIDLPLSSFSSSHGQAIDFAYVRDPSVRSFVMVLEGPKKAVSIEAFNHYAESEYLTQGTFEVSKIEKAFTLEDEKPYTIIRVKHKGVF